MRYWSCNLLWRSLRARRILMILRMMWKWSFILRRRKVMCGYLSVRCGVNVRNGVLRRWTVGFCILHLGRTIWSKLSLQRHDMSLFWSELQFVLLFFNFGISRQLLQVSALSRCLCFSRRSERSLTLPPPTAPISLRHYSASSFSERTLTEWIRKRTTITTLRCYLYLHRVNGVEICFPLFLFCLGSEAKVATCWTIV